MVSIKINFQTFARVQREMKGKFPEEKKKIWKKTVAKEIKQRQMKKKIWKIERKKAREIPIFEEQIINEIDEADTIIEDINYITHSYHHLCLEQPEHICYDYTYWNDYDYNSPISHKPRNICENCEKRIYKDYLNDGKILKIINNVNIPSCVGCTGEKFLLDIMTPKQHCDDCYQYYSDKIKFWRDYWINYYKEMIKVSMTQLNNIKKKYIHNNKPIIKNILLMLAQVNLIY